ncbi:MAG: zf-HC2 domain-containing protein [Pyrinomonadaceae bacterium]|nr:zf-HC2 domain-containing protein [Pyrinomonadaceae bacterium]
MKEKPEQHALCARAEDLVTYLYGEASEKEAADFKRHMEECRSCKSELAAFSHVREDVVEWRNLSLPSFESSTAPVLEPAVTERKRSALAAIREFFSLAPMWMRAATAFAAIAICALVVFTVMHFSEPRTIVQVAPQVPAKPQGGEIAKQREEAASPKEKEVKETQQVAVATTAPSKSSAETVKVNNAQPRVKSRRLAAAPSTVAQRSTEKPDKAKASKEAREQLAELVQTSKDDDGLPRLSDLFEDSNDSN